MLRRQSVARKSMSTMLPSVLCCGCSTVREGNALRSSSRTADITKGTWSGSSRKQRQHVSEITECFHYDSCLQVTENPTRLDCDVAVTFRNSNQPDLTVMFLLLSGQICCQEQLAPLSAELCALPGLLSFWDSVEQWLFQAALAYILPGLSPAVKEASPHPYDTNKISTLSGLSLRYGHCFSSQKWNTFR